MSDADAARATFARAAMLSVAVATIPGDGSRSATVKRFAGVGRRPSDAIDNPRSSRMYTGSCLCQAVQLELHGPISDIIHCHCSKCRKSSGTAYATNGFVSSADLTITRGAGHVRTFETAPGRRRHFCGTCASPLYSSNADDPGRLRLRLGILDSDIAERPISHNFVSSRACWDDLDACLPRFDAHEPGRHAADIMFKRTAGSCAASRPAADARFSTANDETSAT